MRAEAGEGRSGPADRGAWGAWGLRLRALSVARFGALRDLRLGPLGPGLTILAGPNEAGKSTLLAFWVGMLYDLPPLSRGGEPVNLYRPEPADGWGGEVELESPLGPLLLGRRFHEKRGRGRLWLERDGVTLEAAEAEAELARLLGRMERSDYTAVFAFSLAELADLRQLAAGEVGRRIYSAGFGAAEIPAVEQRLEQERNAIWRPQGRTGRELNRLLLELADIERRLAAARGELEQLEPLRRERAETEAELRRLEPELAEAEAEARQLARLLDLRPRWREWRRLAQEVERERGLAALPADAVERLEELRRRRERLEERRRRLAEAVAAEEAVLAEPLPAAVLEAAGEVEALLGEWPEQERRLAGAAQLEAELAETERRLEQRAARLGLDPAALEGVVERRPEADEEEGRRHAREALKARERAEALRGQMQQLELAGAEAAAALPAGAGTGALLARAAAGGLGLAGLVALAARLLGGPAWAGWLGLLALAAALAVALAPAGWREAELRRSLETERLRWRSRRERLAEALAAAVREEEQARARLAAWCGRVGIPRGLPAEELEAWLMEAREARDEMARRRRQRERLEALRAEAEAFRRRLAALAGRVGAAAEPAALRQRLEAARGQLQRRERAAAELRRLEAERRQLEAEAAEVEAGVRALLERGGVSDEAELPAVAARAARWREEAARLATLEGELRAGALELWPAAGDPLAELGERLAAGGDELESRQAAAAGRAEALRLRLAQAQRRLGELGLRAEQLERSRRVAELEDEEARLRAHVEERAAAWRRLTLAAELLAAGRERFERERQPGVIRSASRLFERFTGGRYQGVSLSLGERLPRLHPAAPGAAPLEPWQLSRATQEQLYLAMRLAYIEEVRRSGGSLPVVIDDALVDFDPARLGAALRALGEFAEGQQVLLFTCHPHVVEAARREVPGARVLELG